MEHYASIPAVTGESVLGSRILKNQKVTKQVMMNSSVSANVRMVDARLALEHEAGHALPRVVMYMNGYIESLSGPGLAQVCDTCTFETGSEQDDHFARGTDIHMRYVMSDTQAARCMLRGVSRLDWTGLDTRLLSNKHELPLSADITCAMVDDAPYPFLVVDVNNRMLLDFNRKTCGYDYTDFVGVAPSAIAEIGAERMQMMDETLKQFDYERMMHAVEPEQQKVSSAEPTYYDQRLFDDIFAEDEQPVSDTKQPERHEVVSHIEQESVVEKTMDTMSISSMVDEMIVEREQRRRALAEAMAERKTDHTASEQPVESVVRQSALQSSLLVAIDTLDDDEASDDEVSEPSTDDVDFGSVTPNAAYDGLGM